VLEPSLNDGTMRLRALARVSVRLIDTTTARKGHFSARVHAREASNALENALHIYEGARTRIHAASPSCRFRHGNVTTASNLRRTWRRARARVFNSIPRDTEHRRIRAIRHINGNSRAIVRVRLQFADVMTSWYH